MPPKKARAAKAEAADAIAQTAAAERPRRAATKEAASAPAKKLPSKKTPVKKAPAKAAPAPPTDATTVSKKRGRPAKTEEAEADPEPPKKRGRPAKNELASTEQPKKRGRPPKATTAAEDAATTKDAPAVSEAEKAPPKKRGRPPKGGETTKISADDPAAAEQLEEELVDAAEADEQEPTSKRAPPVKKDKAVAKGKARTVESTDPKVADAAEGVDSGVDAPDAAGDDEGGVVVKEGQGQERGKQYWLMKAEQVDREETLPDGSVFNAKFTIDDLRAKGTPEPWDGVRSAVACKNMREMKEGDLAFFYASGAKGKALQPGITGIMEIVKEHEPDMSAFDENHPYYVQNAKQRGTTGKPKWSLVHVEFRKKLMKPVGLKELQQFKHDSGVLANMQEFTAARLSVSKVTEKEWNFIVNELIEGYEGETTPTPATRLS